MANALQVGFDPYADTQGLADEALRPGFDPYADTQGFDTGGLFSGIGKAIKKASRVVKAVVKKAAPVLGPVVDMARTALKNMGPIGMVANGAIGAIGAGLSGKGIGDIALAAAVGAAPTGIDRAIQAAADLAKGKPILKVALGQAVKSFVPGSAERFAFNTGVDVLKKATIAVAKNASTIKGTPAQNIKAALGEARRSLADEAQRRAFDSAVGTVSRAASGVRAAQVPTSIATARRVLQAPKVLPAPPRRAPVSIIHPNIRRTVSTIQRSPGLAGKTPMEIATKIGQPVSVVQRALRIAPARLGWRPLSSGAAAFIRRYVQHAPMAALRDTRGLTADGATYTVEPGDFPGKIAKKIAPGNAENRWPELIAANPQKKTTQTNIGKVFATLFAGEKLIVPPSWRKAAAAPPMVTTLPEVTITPSPIGGPPTVTPVSTTPAQASTDTAAVLQAKATLIAWSKTDGLNEAGFPDYGLRPEDMSTSFGTRDKFVAKSFANWSNRTAKTSLSLDGELSPSLVAALRAWAERRAGIPLPAIAVPGFPGLTPPAAAPPAVVSTPIPMPPELAPTPAPSSPAAPSTPANVIPFPVPPALQPSAPSSPAAQPKTAAAGGGDILPIAAAAGLGWVAGGPIGAAVGGLAGVFLSS